MSGKKNTPGRGYETYQEVSVKPSVYIMIAVVAAVALPLGWLNLKIGAEGSKIADTSEYRPLVAGVQRDLQTMKGVIDSAHLDEKALKNALAPRPTLITPDIDILPANPDQASKDTGSKSKIKLSAIYWSRTDPIVTINGENYKEGDYVEGHRILDIRETEVLFEDPMGNEFVKDFYDYLGN
jgi:hypothetical protein